MIFFFKQKTAYEMRISDWSSDVCSSDLGLQPNSAETSDAPTTDERKASSPSPARIGESAFTPHFQSQTRQPASAPVQSQTAARARYCRSEEHTSELQSLMRISYAVFCLKKKT